MLAERRAEPIEYRRSQHELHELARQPIEQFPEVRTDRALRAGEIAHILAEILPQPNRRGRRDPQGRRPALRLLVQEFHVGWNERAGFLGLEKILRLLQIESERRRIDLQQLVLRAERRERQRRPSPAGPPQIPLSPATLQNEPPPS